LAVRTALTRQPGSLSPQSYSPRVLTANMPLIAGPELFMTAVRTADRLHTRNADEGESRNVKKQAAHRVDSEAQLAAKCLTPTFFGGRF